ncbi:MAG: EMC3/TMCO1 family protein [Candidatus Hodarchaeota archaeon]
MTNVDIILQIMFISIGMVALSLLLNRVLGINLNTAKELREKALNLQERMRTAQITGDGQELIKLQRESTALMKQMMKKQLIPSCFRCLVFIGIFALIGIFYANYTSGLLPFLIPLLGDGWVALYFLFSLGFSLLAYGLKRLYRKVTGKTSQKARLSKEILDVLSPRSQETGVGFQLTRPLPSSSASEETSQGKQIEKLDSWKDKITKK